MSDQICDRIWIASLHDSDGNVTGEVVIHDEQLVDDATHGGWTVTEYVRAGQSLNPSEFVNYVSLGARLHILRENAYRGSRARRYMLTTHPTLCGQHVYSTSDSQAVSAPFDDGPVLALALCKSCRRLYQGGAR